LVLPLDELELDELDELDDELDEDELELSLAFHHLG
jgi:hypothetical protein